MFERRVEISPAFDKRHPDPAFYRAVFDEIPQATIDAAKARRGTDNGNP